MTFDKAKAKTPALDAETQVSSFLIDCIAVAIAR